MRFILQDLFDKDQTGAEMYRIIEQFSDDLDRIQIIYNGKKKPFSRLSLLEAFDVIRSIPYKQDTAPVEIVSRPAYITNETGADCKKKSILMGSFLKKNGIPFRLVAVSTMPDRRVHHVFTQAKINGEWKNLDPTYSNAEPFEQKTVTKYEVLK